MGRRRGRRALPLGRKGNARWKCLRRKALILCGSIMVALVDMGPLTIAICGTWRGDMPYHSDMWQRLMWHGNSEPMEHELYASCGSGG